MDNALSWESDAELRLMLVAMIFSLLGKDAVEGEVVELAQEFFNFILGTAETVMLHEVKAGA